MSTRANNNLLAPYSNVPSILHLRCILHRQLLPHPYPIEANDDNTGTHVGVDVLKHGEVDPLAANLSLTR